MDTADFEARGLYDPDAPNASERLELLEYLMERGATLDEMVEALHAGTLVALASDIFRRGDARRESPRTLADAVGIPLDLVLAVSRAAGLPTPDPDAPAFRPRDGATFRTFQAGADLFGADATLQFTRTVGAALASIADAAMTIFGLNVAEPMDERGASELDRAKAAEFATGLLLEEVPRALETLFYYHVESAVRRNVASTTADGAYLLAHLAVGFLDLAGSTPLARGLDPAMLADALNEFEQSAMEAITARDGRVVKTIGDEVMFVAADIGGACEAALTLREFVADHPVLTALRGGVAAGNLVRGYGDYYGPEVTRAARIVRLAEPGQLLATAAVRDLAGARRGLSFIAAGEHLLRGFEVPTELFVVERA